jgi:hypothetical protein
LSISSDDRSASSRDEDSIRSEPATAARGLLPADAVRRVEPVIPAAPAVPVHPSQLGMTGAKDAFLAAIP